MNKVTKQRTCSKANSSGPWFLNIEYVSTCWRGKFFSVLLNLFGSSSSYLYCDIVLSISHYVSSRR
uniref:Putative ovule protein n=1 Tax=Solanum chacoense TaxID=4108 RepID=A0A0V0GUX5_SOLCH